MGQVWPSGLVRAKRTAWLWLAVALGACGGGAPEQGPTTQALRASAATYASSQFAGNGWYWNPAQGGTGFFLEAQGNYGFLGIYLYDNTGRPVWYVAYGSFAATSTGFSFSSQVGYTYNGSPGGLLLPQSGQALSSSTYTAPSFSNLGNVSANIRGSDVSTAITLFLPGGRTVVAQRYTIAGGGLYYPPTSTQPETGFFWDPTAGGRGWAVEVQNNQLFAVVFHYNADGSPTWNVVQGDITGGTLGTSLAAYSGGQTLTSAYVAPVGPLSVGPYDVQFAAPCTGTFTYPGLAPVQVFRFRFGDLPAGAQCRAATTPQVVASFTNERQAAQQGLSLGLTNAIRHVLTLQRSLLTTPPGQCLALNQIPGAKLGPGMGSVSHQLNAQGTGAMAVFYDAQCSQKYLDLSLSPGAIQARVLGTDGVSNMATLNLSTQSDAVLGQSATQGSVNLPDGTRAQIGLYDTLDPNATSLSGQSTSLISQDFADLNLSLGASTNLNLRSNSSWGNVSQSGSAQGQIGPLQALVLGSGSAPYTLQLSGGSQRMAWYTTANQTSYALWSAAPLNWTSADSATDVRFQLNLLGSQNRSMLVTVVQNGTGAPLARAVLDASGSGTIYYSNGNVAQVRSWVQSALTP